MSEQAQSSGHEWMPDPTDMKYGKCSCGYPPKGCFIRKDLWQYHFVASVAQAAQPQEVPAPDTLHKIMRIISAGETDGGEFNGDTEYAIAEIRKVLAAAQEVPAEQRALCPSCRASDNEPFTDANGVAMRACGRCMIQWRAAQPASAAKPAEDGLEAQLSEVLAAHMFLVGEEWNDCECKCGLDFPAGYDAAGKVSVYPKDSWISHITPLLIKAIRTHQAAREQELQAKFSADCLALHETGRKCATCGREEDLVKAIEKLRESEARERELREKLEGLLRDWDWGESNSLYGLDENGNKIPMRGGTECAKELRALLASHWPAQKEGK